MRFIAGFNMPGYLPESEPEECDTLEEAREALACELVDRADAAESEAQAREYDRAVMRLRAGCIPEPGESFEIEGMSYWINVEW